MIVENGGQVNRKKGRASGYFTGNGGIAGGPAALRAGTPAASGHLPNDDSIF